MKKLISLALSAAMLFSMSITVLAKAPNNSAASPSPYIAYDDTIRNISAGSSWTSYQYYCAAGDYFSGYCDAFSGRGSLKITVYYASSVGGTRTSVTSTTISSNEGGEAYTRASKSGYYNAVIKNTGSTNLSVRCGVTVN